MIFDQKHCFKKDFLTIGIRTQPRLSNINKFFTIYNRPWEVSMTLMGQWAPLRTHMST